ncbi:protein NYNRIN-like [Pecten maximus]|uniref:protein NYNRIN-like n=1 Tax=Pecten maximus TaxID=6579 RepID=UPI001458E45F|nr:protein NYNRIN-like [Pecten maximus]
MAEDCKGYKKACVVCNVNKKSCRKPKAALQRYHAGYSMEIIHLDILGPFASIELGNSYVLVMIDQLLKWIECVALPNQSADLIARKFFSRFVVTFRCPLAIHTNQGRNFDGKLFREFCEILQITKTRTTPYHPSSNRQIEHYNRVIAQIIQCYIEGKIRHWDKDLTSLVMALHATENKSTGYTPNRLMLGREIMLPVDIMMGVSQANLEDFEPAEWVQNLNRVMAEAHQFARHHLESTQIRQKKDYDLKLCEQMYSTGDTVYKLDEAIVVGQSRKLRPPWKGPYLVVGSEPPLYILLDNRKSYFPLCGLSCGGRCDSVSSTQAMNQQDVR